MIKADNLSKVYKLYDRPIDRLKESLHPFRKKYHRDFYALNDVSFEVNKGETVGIVGKNGSGKSTLLKILSGVLTPSGGTFAVNGRISALLELGTGFNPEFTGIENIYFSGTIMGFSKEDMDGRYDDILAFADIGAYIDQPVKTYSSGMFVRLAFAIAIIVDPEILIVDEAFAVGDMRFQQKCIRKMNSFREKGKTILFVSHDTGAINNFCDKTMWLHDGNIREFGQTEPITKRYFSFMAFGQETTVQVKDKKDSLPEESLKCEEIVWENVKGCESFGELGAQILGVALYSKDTNEKTNIVRPRENVIFYIHAKIMDVRENMGFGIMLKDRLGNGIFTINNCLYEKVIMANGCGELMCKCEFNFPNISVGKYSFVTSLFEGTQQNHIQHQWIHDSYLVEVTSDDIINHMGCILSIDRDKVSIHYETIKKKV